MIYYSEDKYNNLGRNPSAEEKIFYKNCMYYSNLSVWASAMPDIEGSSELFPNSMEPFRFDTYDIAGFCIPKVSEILSEDTITQLKEAFVSYVYGDGVAKVVDDIFASWPVILASIGIAFISGYIFLIILRIFGGCLIWIAFIASVVLAAGAGVYAWGLKDHEDYAGTDTADYLTYSAYALWIIAGTFFLILMCCYSRLALGIAVFKTTVDFTASNCCIFFLPLIGMVLMLGWFAIWLASFIFVFSVGEVTQREEPFSFLTEIMWEDNTRYILILQVFGLLWVANFLNGCQQFVIACSACIWYFTV